MPSPAPPDRAGAPADGNRWYRTRHVTRYDYGEAVSVSHHLVHLVPRAIPRQHCLRAILTIMPSPQIRRDGMDYFGNPITYFALHEPHRGLVITAETTVAVRPPAVFDTAASPAWNTLPERLAAAAGPDALDANQYLHGSTLVRVMPALADYAAASFKPDLPIAVAALDLMRRIHRDFTFDPTATTVSTPLDQVLRARRGVCQDFAHLGVGCLRALGLAARYVSGYMRTHPPPGRPRLIGADASHAWFSVWCGGEGWLDLDPTNDRPADDDYIAVAWGRDYDDVSPVRGVLIGGYGHGLRVEVDVEPLEEEKKRGA